jgi:hypothetical protein
MILFACLMVLNTTFNNISVISRRSILLYTTDLSKVTDKLYYIMLYTLPWSRFDLTTSVVIGTDCICSCKSIYHAITAMTSPWILIKWFFSRHDWNLLSTGTPAINAWLNPFDRLIYSVKHLILALTHRTSSVMACIMTDGLEESSVHFPRKVNFRNFYVYV